MTAPNIDLESIVPSKAKTAVGLIGSLVTFLGPFILSSTDALPPPWPVVIGLVFAVLTALGVYHAPYKPTGTVLAPQQGPAAPEVPLATPDNPSPPFSPSAGTPQISESYQNPWKQ